MNFKGLYEHERKGKRLTCFEYPIYHIPLLSIIFGVLGLVSASLHQKESGLDYTTEKILSIIGIFLSVVFCIVFISQLSGIH